MVIGVVIGGGVLAENSWPPKIFSEQTDAKEHVIPFVVSTPPEVNWTSNPPFKSDEKKTTAEGAMLTTTPANEYEKLVMSVTDISVPSFTRSVAETGFGKMRENDHVSPGALQVLVGAPLPQTPEPEMVAESARAPAAPRAASPSIIPKRQRCLRINLPIPALSNGLRKHGWGPVI